MCTKQFSTSALGLIMLLSNLQNCNMQIVTSVMKSAALCLLEILRAQYW